MEEAGDFESRREGPHAVQLYCVKAPHKGKGTDQFFQHLLPQINY
jgi:hypothetical protein